MKFRPVEITLTLLFVAVFGAVFWLGSADTKTAKGNNRPEGNPSSWGGQTEQPAAPAMTEPLPAYSAGEPDARPEPVDPEKARVLKEKQRREALPEFIKAADKDIARVQKEIEDARAQRAPVQTIAAKEEKLRQMQEVRQQTLARNADISP